MFVELPPRRVAGAPVEQEELVGGGIMDDAPFVIVNGKHAFGIEVNGIYTGDMCGGVGAVLCYGGPDVFSIRGDATNVVFYIAGLSESNVCESFPLRVKDEYVTYTSSRGAICAVNDGAVFKRLCRLGVHS
jgi:hypothetical protein